MQAENTRNTRLGLFVVAGTAILIFSLYFIGSKQNLFGSTIRISASFYNVNGLMQGNNVRFAGINIGTVEQIEIINDSSVKVIMLIEKKIQPYIKKNARASIGTDGLMGNKLVNINSGKSYAAVIEEGDMLGSLNPIEMDEMIRTLNSTNENINVISSNLRTITDKINSKNSLWSLLMDTIVADNVKSTLVNIKLMSNQGIMITGNLKSLSKSMKKGEGSLGALITDTVLSSRVNQTIVNLKRLSDTAAFITGDISGITAKLKSGKGNLGVLLNDTMLVNDLNKSIKNIESGAHKFDVNMEALRHSWPFKKYFRKQKKDSKLRK